MFRLENLTNKIYITRGDSASFTFIPYYRAGLDEFQYVFNKDDEIYLGIMEPNQCWEDALVKKKYTYADLNSDQSIDVKFNPNDTMCLYPGLYYYQIKIRSFNNDDVLVDTLIPKTEFWIEE